MGFVVGDCPEGRLVRVGEVGIGVVGDHDLADLAVLFDSSSSFIPALLPSFFFHDFASMSVLGLVSFAGGILQI